MNLLLLALLLVLRTRNNTDGNKLVVFSGIASYYGDNKYCCLFEEAKITNFVINYFVKEINESCLHNEQVSTNNLLLLT